MIEMTDKEIFINTETKLFPEKYRNDIELIGKDAYLNLLLAYGGQEMYFPKPSNLAFEFTNNINKNFIDSLKLTDICEPYNKYAECIGIENLYELSKKYSGSIMYLPKLLFVIQRIKNEKVREEIRQGKKVMTIAAKYKLCSRRIRSLRQKEILEDYKNGISIEELACKYNMNVKWIEFTVNNKN